MKFLSPHASQMLFFVSVGAFAAIINFLSRLLISLWFPYALAVVLAYLIGMAVAFLLNRYFIFYEATNKLHIQILRFTIVNIFALAQVLLISLLFADIILPRIGIRTHTEEYAHAVGIAVPIVTSYLGHKYWSFRDS